MNLRPFVAARSTITGAGHSAAALVLIVLGLQVPCQSAQNLLGNGDFETGDLTGWTWTPMEHAEPMMSVLALVGVGGTVPSTPVIAPVHQHHQTTGPGPEPTERGT